MIKQLSILTIISSFVGICQISLVENKLNDYGFENNVSSYLPKVIFFQNNIENLKLSFKTNLSDLVKNNNTEENNNTQIQEPLTVAVIQQPLEQTNKEITEEPKTIGPTIKPEINSTILAKKIIKETPVIEYNDNSLTNLNNSDPTINQNNSDPNLIINKKCIKNCIILMVGDSVMGDVFYSLSRKIKKEHPDFKVIDGHKVSSGLSNTTYYDWPTIAQQLTEKYTPNYTFVLLGMNDAQGISSDHRSHSFGSIPWIETYKERTHNFKEIITKNSDNMIWIELPQVRENKFNNRLSIIRNIHKEENSVNFLNTDTLLGNNTNSTFGNYRQNDGIHLNAQGSDKITEKIMNIFKS